MRTILKLMTVAGCAFALLATSCSEAPVSTNEVKSSGISAKSSTLAQKSAKVHLKFKGSNFGSEIDSAIGTLTTIYLKRDGNVPAKDNRITSYNVCYTKLLRLRCLETKLFYMLIFCFLIRNNY